MLKDSSSPPTSRKENPSLLKGLSAFLILFTTFIAFLFSQILAAIIIYVVALLSAVEQASFEGWSNSTGGVFVYAAVVHIFYILFVWVYLAIMGRKPESIGLGRRPVIPDLLKAVLAYGVYLTAFVVTYILIQKFATGIDVNQNQDIGFQPEVRYELILSYISLAIITPIAEEVLFRGYLFSGLKRQMKPVIAGLMTSLLFGAAHLGGFSGDAKLNWIVAIDTFVLSIVLCYLVEKNKSLWPAIFLHAIKNSVAFVALFLIK